MLFRTCPWYFKLEYKVIMNYSFPALLQRTMNIKTRVIVISFALFFSSLLNITEIHSTRFHRRFKQNFRYSTCARVSIMLSQTVRLNAQMKAVLFLGYILGGTSWNFRLIFKSLVWIMITSHNPRYYHSLFSVSELKIGAIRFVVTRLWSMHQSPMIQIICELRCFDWAHILHFTRSIDIFAGIIQAIYSNIWTLRKCLITFKNIENYYHN